MFLEMYDKVAKMHFTIHLINLLNQIYSWNVVEHNEYHLSIKTCLRIPPPTLMGHFHLLKFEGMIFPLPRGKMID